MDQEPNNALDENKLIAERRAKLTGLREQGNAYPNDFRRARIEWVMRFFKKV